MTENKRFNFVGGYLYDGNEPVGHIEDVKFRQDFEDLVNELHEENTRLREEVKKLDTFKKILEYAEKDKEERADWQAYCEKEFEGL